MSVYTPVSVPQLNKLLKDYPLGKLINFAGIENGIENSNYRIETSGGHFILTLFEELAKVDLQQIFALLEHLHDCGLPVPQPQTDHQGRILHTINGKATAFFNHLPGSSILTPTPTQCHEIGAQLARLHVYARQHNFKCRNHKDLNGCKSLFLKLKPYLKQSDINKISAELLFQQQHANVKLPKGVIHADLFRDNILFDNERISGILDFYNSCHDYLLLDIAIALNDWCIDNTTINCQKLEYFLRGYQSVRKLEALEKKWLPVFLRRASLRFWLSRLEHQLFPKTGAITQQKNPSRFKNILDQHCKTPVITATPAD